MEYFKINTEKLPEPYKSWDFHNCIDRICEFHDVNPYHIYSLIMTESSGDTFSFRYEKGYRWIYEPHRNKYPRHWKVSKDSKIVAQQISFGLCHVMGSSYIDLGFNDLPTNMMRPKIGIEAGVRYWVKMRHAWGENPLDIYSAYNHGSLEMYGNRYFNHDKVMNYKQNLKKLINF